MKKILIAFDGKHFSKGAFDFVRHMNEQEKVLAVGVFLPLVDYSQLLYSLGGMAGPLYIAGMEDEDLNMTEKNIAHFEDQCRKNGIEYRVHSGLSSNVSSKLKEETRYADLMVLSSELFYEHLGEDTQQDYIETVLHKSECPVLLMPERYHEPKSVILSYDGSESSVHAIKQFSYLFPGYRKLQTLLIYTNTGKQAIPAKDHIQELTSRHFEDLTVFKLKVAPGEEFEKWVLTNHNPLLVTGAYGRSLLSEFLKKSFVKQTIQNHKIPLFVAHR